MRALLMVAMAAMLTGCTEREATDYVGNTLRSICIQYERHCDVVCEGEKKPGPNGRCG